MCILLVFFVYIQYILDIYHLVVKVVLLQRMEDVWWVARAGIRIGIRIWVRFVWGCGCVFSNTLSNCLYECLEIWTVVNFGFQAGLLQLIRIRTKWRDVNKNNCVNYFEIFKKQSSCVRQLQLKADSPHKSSPASVSGGLDLLSAPEIGICCKINLG